MELRLSTRTKMWLWYDVQKYKTQHSPRRQRFMRIANVAIIVCMAAMSLGGTILLTNWVDDRIPTPVEETP